jgi:hypothetical protein
VNVLESAGLAADCAMCDMCYVVCGRVQMAGKRQRDSPHCVTLVAQAREEVKCPVETFRRMKTLHDLFQSTLSRSSDRSVPVSAEKEDLTLLINFMAKTVPHLPSNPNGAVVHHDPKPDFRDLITLCQVLQCAASLFVLSCIAVQRKAGLKHVMAM